jgi:hypothetical protein
MSQLTESQEKTNQQIALRETSPSSARSFQDGLHPILQLQRMLGNRRMAQLIQAKQLTLEGKIIGFQRKLIVGAADDQYEQEADRVARDVVNTADPVAASSMQREKETEPIQAKSAGSMSDSFDAGVDVETQVTQSKGLGSPLPDPVRTYMEPRFGSDFSAVRAHTGSDAIQMNRNVGARAFTHGSDIYFGEGHSPANLELTAHELTHVIQQTGNQPLQAKKGAADREERATVDVPGDK